MNHGAAVAYRVACRLGQRFDLDPPLQRQPRFDRFAAALGVSDAVQVRPLLGDDASLLGQRLADLDAGLEAVQAVEFGSGVGDPALGVHDRRHRQLMAHADLEVVGIVCRGDFDCARAELGVDVCVGDDDSSRSTNGCGRVLPTRSR